MDKEAADTVKKILLCMLLALALSAQAFALEVPTGTVVQNLNGSQQLIKTYTLPPDADPQKLVEAPFEQEGFLYTFADIVKDENFVQDQKHHVETVTLETDTDSLAAILEQLEPTMEYDDGTYAGALSLDHNSIRTEATGYTSKSSTVSTTKTIGPVDRNDMSYVPATATKDGLTLKLSNVDWQVIGTDVVGDSLAPTSYQAVATYTGTRYTKVADGYVTKADYTGSICHEGVESITYRVTYLGTPAEEVDLPQEDQVGAAAVKPEKSGTAAEKPSVKTVVSAALPAVLGIAAVAAVAVLSVLLVRSRRQVQMLQPPEDGNNEEEVEEEHR